MPITITIYTTGMIAGDTIIHNSIPTSFCLGFFSLHKDVAKDGVLYDCVTCYRPCLVLVFFWHGTTSHYFYTCFTTLDVKHVHVRISVCGTKSADAYVHAHSDIYFWSKPITPTPH